MAKPIGIIRIPAHAWEGSWVAGIRYPMAILVQNALKLKGWLCGYECGLYTAKSSTRTRNLGTSCCENACWGSPSLAAQPPRPPDPPPTPPDADPGPPRSTVTPSLNLSVSQGL
eukprot:999794-Rhodomonas_salina.2